MHGRGIAHDKDGNIIYEGEFKNNEFDGKGKRYLDNGKFYEGEFINGKYHGKGKLFFENGNFYEGEFINGKSHGKGIIKNKNNETVYEGEFKYGNFENGTLYFTNGKYIGQFIDNKRSKGKLYKDNKLIYDGEFKNDKYEGNGTLYIDNDYIYVGEFKNNKMEGTGIIYDKNWKEKYKGQFINGELVDKICNIF